MQREGWEMGIYLFATFFHSPDPQPPSNKKRKHAKNMEEPLQWSVFPWLSKGECSYFHGFFGRHRSGVPSHVGCECWNLGDFQHASNCRKLRLSHRTCQISGSVLVWFLKQWQLKIFFMFILPGGNDPIWVMFSFKWGWFNCKVLLVFFCNGSVRHLYIGKR